MEFALVLSLLVAWLIGRYINARRAITPFLLAAFAGWAIHLLGDGYFAVSGGTLAGLLAFAVWQQRQTARLHQRLHALEARLAQSSPATTEAARPLSPAAAMPQPEPASLPSTPAVATTPVPVPAPAITAHAEADIPTPTNSMASIAAAVPVDTASGTRPTATQPDWLVRASRLVRQWLFEGNIPVKIGMLILLIGAGAALRYAAQTGLFSLPMPLRLAIAALAALGMLGWGLRSARQRPTFGLTLQGGALGILMLIVFSAFRLYHLLPATVALALIIVLVACGSILAVRQHAQALAFMSLSGGYLAPLLLSTGSGNHVALFSFYAVLNAAVLLVAWLRPWRALNLLGFAFTFGVGTMWGARAYRDELFASVEPFLILFFLFYAIIPLLYARTPRAVTSRLHARLDHTLLFGTPLLAFGLQAAMLTGQPMALAYSALAVAFVYALLCLWARRITGGQLLSQALAGIALAFVTLAIPLALSAQWTSTIWALQGAGLVWLGQRQSRRLLILAGLLLQGAAAIALLDHISYGAISELWPLSLWSLFKQPDTVSYRLSIVLLSLSALVSAWLLDRPAPRPMPRAQPILAGVMLVWGLFWGYALGLWEILFEQSIRQPLPVLAAFTALLAGVAALAYRPLAWRKLAWPMVAAAALCAFYALLSMSDSRTPLTLTDWRQLPWLLVPGALLLACRALVAGHASAHPQAEGSPTTPSKTLPIVHLCMLGLVAILASTTLSQGMQTLAYPDAGRLSYYDDIIYHGGLLTLGAWAQLAYFLPWAFMLWLAWEQPQRAGWPIGQQFLQWCRVWLVIASLIPAILWLSALFHPGDSLPLPFWVPVLNPTELLLFGGLAGTALAMRQSARPLPAAAWLGWSAALFAALTSSVLRACHHWADLPWHPGLLATPIAQISLSIAWSIAGVVAWIAGSRHGNRAIWTGGAILLGLVLLKLLLVDRQYIGNLTGIASFLAVGMLLVVVGRIAPSPPRTPRPDSQGTPAS
ncbi:DUF2339 domain-containing protein [Corticimicrobacter populi]|uniref:DUF2339 domain-containing protein n=1 Tax=Corticimicrobacter populi TaxID=2175229 RepID=A0A2V1K0U8_9BURK|nr:DUF2339 domain-containing protein [Corticimicrobacter populi]PWF22648.1 hypothetical protein DD235_11260 [Corticimicrobacter populi]